MFRHIAVLIDADNISSQKFDWVFDKISTLGEISTKRIYGDFTKAHLSSWEGFILKYAIEKKHQTSYSTGKNSSDIALTIDAMDLLHSGHHDAFCIVSSDSDFIGLSLRLRRHHLHVFGFGNANTIKEFRQVCSQFFEIPSDVPTTPPQKPKPTADKKLIKEHTANELKSNTKLLNALRESIKNNKPNDNGWVNYAVFSSYMQKNHPAIKPENYGYAKLYEIIDVIDLFEAKKEHSTIFIRAKPAQNSQTANTKPWSADKMKQNTPLIHALQDSIHQNLENGWTNFSVFAQHMHKHHPTIQPKNYGYGKWRTLMDQLDLFEFKQINKTKLCVRQKSHPSSNTKTIHHQKLLDDILHIINDNALRQDEWVHIGYLGSQLKNRGYDPKEFGEKSFTALLSSLQGIDSKIVDGGYYYTLTDKSNIKPINPTASKSEPKTQSPIDFKTTPLYQILFKNKDKLNAKIKELIAKNHELNVFDFWELLSKNLTEKVLLDNNQSYDCFLQFIQDNLNQDNPNELQLLTKDSKAILVAKRSYQAS